MGIGYNAISNNAKGFTARDTFTPLIGYKTNDDVNAHSYDGYFAENSDLVAGDFIEATPPAKETDAIKANNPNVFSCKKATTGKISGVLLHSNNEVVGIGNNSGLIQKGQLFKWAGIGSGCEVYLKVHTTNATAITTTTTFPIKLTADLTNGGVKVANGSDVVIGYAISNLITNCLSQKLDSGDVTMESCLGIKVRL